MNAPSRIKMNTDLPKPSVKSQEAPEQGVIFSSAEMPLPSQQTPHISGLVVNLAYARSIFGLIERATSMPVVKDFLKEKSLHHSASSWETLYKSRIEPALISGQITIPDLHKLLRTVEEYGRQHVFVYKCEPSRAAAILSPQRIANLLQQSGSEALSENPIILELPEKPTITDIRLERHGKSSVLVIKEVETRTVYVPIGTVRDPETKILSKKYQPENKRVVNIARLHSEGFLELRIASRDNTTKYKEDVDRFFCALRTIFNRDEFQDWSLAKVKDALWERRETLKELVRYSDYTLKNDNGTTLRAATAFSTEDLNDDDAAQESLSKFRQTTAICLSSNIFFKIPGSEPPREVHVLLSGEANEFALTAACKKEDYEYVLEQIRQNNK